MRNGVLIGKTTKPFGHAESGINSINRLQTAMRRVLQDCRDQGPGGGALSTQDMLDMVKILGFGATAYIVISEGSRIYLPRNAIPIP
jgi:hypothetical protein